MKKLIQFELYKTFSKRLTSAALITLLLLSFLFSFSSYRNMHAYDGVSNEGSGHTAVEIDKYIAKKYEGLLTDEKVQEMMTDFAPKFDLHGLNACYLYLNAIQSAVFARFTDENGDWNGLSVSDVFGDEDIKIGYTYGWLKTSQNMVPIFIILSLIIIIMTAPVFSGEYSGVDNIILTSKYGKTKCTMSKVIASIMASLIVTSVVSAINFILAFVMYGSNGLNCSILFAPREFIDGYTGYIPFNITLGTLLKYQFLLAFTSAISITGITLVLSAMCKNQVTALIASAAIYFLPFIIPVSETNPMFRYITLLPIYHVQFISLMSIEQMRGGMLYALFAVPVALVFIGIGIVLSRRIFAKHQVL